MASTGLKAIETVYNGYRFRSRLEARWAVFLDSLGVRYEYEPQGFDLHGTWYLPDFFVPDWDAYLEIKPPVPSEILDGLEKTMALCQASHQRTMVIAGSPWFLEYGVGLWEPPWETTPPDLDAVVARWGEPAVYVSIDGLLDVGTFAIDRRCDCIWLTDRDPYDAWGVQLSGGCGRDTPHGRSPLKDPDDVPRLRNAYIAARQARFEHGEAPRFAPAPGPPQRLTTDTIHDIDNLIWAYCTRFQTWHTAQAIAAAIGRPEQHVIRALARLVGRETLRRDLTTDHTTVYSVPLLFSPPNLG